MRDSIRIVGVATLTPARLSQLIANARLHSCDVGPPTTSVCYHALGTDCVSAETWLQIRGSLRVKWNRQRTHYLTFECL
jgi:hypothetical protein